MRRLGSEKTTRPLSKTDGDMRRNKFNAKPTVVDGIRFASQKEARRYQALRLLEKAGEVAQLELQPRYPLVVNKVKVGTYVADFAYYEKRGHVVEDSKGVRTPIYRLKAKLVKALYGIEIRET